VTNGPNRSLIARTLLSDLEREVIRLVPQMVREWQEAPGHVAAPMADFVIRLAAWERTGDGRQWTQCQAGYIAVLEAWGAAFQSHPACGVRSG